MGNPLQEGLGGVMAFTANGQNFGNLTAKGYFLSVGVTGKIFKVILL